MISLKIAVVENENDEAIKNKNLILQYAKEKEIEIDISLFPDAKSFLNNPPFSFDCVFLDIDMPGMNGMDAASLFREKDKDADIVFVTNLPQFAIGGYKVQALDFVLKPTNYSDFAMALDKVKDKKSKEEKSGFVLKNGSIIQHFKNKEVLYIEMRRHDLFVYEDDDTVFSTRGTMKGIEEELNKDVFVKINSGIIVNLAKVRRVEGDTVIMENKATLPISRRHKKEFGMSLSNFYGNHLEER